MAILPKGKRLFNPTSNQLITPQLGVRAKQAIPTLACFHTYDILTAEIVWPECLLVILLTVYLVKIDYIPVLYDLHL